MIIRLTTIKYVVNSNIKKYEPTIRLRFISSILDIYLRCDHKREDNPPSWKFCVSYPYYNSFTNTRPVIGLWTKVNDTYNIFYNNAVILLQYSDREIQKTKDRRILYRRIETLLYHLKLGRENYVSITSPYDVPLLDIQYGFEMKNNTDELILIEHIREEQLDELYHEQPQQLQQPQLQPQPQIQKIETINLKEKSHKIKDYLRPNKDIDTINSISVKNKYTVYYED